MDTRLAAGTDSLDPPGHSSHLLPPLPRDSPQEGKINLSSAEMNLEAKMSALFANFLLKFR